MIHGELGDLAQVAYVGEGAPNGLDAAGYAQWVQELVTAGQADPELWLWCVGCMRTYQLRAYQPGSEMRDVPGFETIYHCPTAGCSRLLEGGAMAWMAVRLRFPDLPEVPTAGQVYPVSRRAQRAFQQQARELLGVVAQANGWRVPAALLR
jgi:hypothetical protein